MNKKEFIEYLKGTLIPDLIESGRDATACDFAIAIKFMLGSEHVEIPCDEEEILAMLQDV